MAGYSYASGLTRITFAGSDTGGERAAIYTLVETAKLNGYDPERYIAGVLARIGVGHPIHRLDELLPWNMAARAERGL